MVKPRTLYIRVSAETDDLIERIAQERGRKKVDVIEDLVSAGLGVSDLEQDLALQLNRVTKLEKENAVKSAEVREKAEQLRENKEQLDALSRELPVQVKRGMEEFLTALRVGVPCECGGCFVVVHRTNDGKYECLVPSGLSPCRGKTVGVGKKERSSENDSTDYLIDFSKLWR